MCGPQTVVGIKRIAESALDGEHKLLVSIERGAIMHASRSRRVFSRRRTACMHLCARLQVVIEASDFDGLVAEADAVSVDGWDFSWLHGRATEQRPSWGYTRMLVPRVERARCLLDVQTGGAEVLVEVLDRAQSRPSTIAATECWGPNVAIARRNLTHLGGIVVEVANDDLFPFPDGMFDLVVSRHPVVNRWDEIARVLDPGGRYFAQHVGPGSNRELTDCVMGAQLIPDTRSAAKAVADAAGHGMDVVDLREESLRVEFYDIGAVVYFLRKVIWTVPDFTVERYRDRLAALHERIRADGVFVSHAQRFLIELRKA